MTSVPHSGAKSVTPGGSVAGGGHTPGPWTAEDRALCSLVFSSSYVGRVAICDQFTERHGPGETERKANARLIAAAPELLEALILLEAEMVLSGNAGSTDYGWKPAICKTRAAIAKATAGETRNAEGAL